MYALPLSLCFYTALILTLIRNAYVPPANAGPFCPATEVFRPRKPNRYYSCAMHACRFHGRAEFFKKLVAIFALIEPDRERVELVGLTQPFFRCRAKSNIHAGPIFNFVTRCVCDLFHVHYRLIPSD